MKKCLFLILIALSACQDDDPKPDNSDMFVGRWFYQKSNIDLIIGFNVAKSGNSYSFSNITIMYAELPDNEDFQYEILPKDRLSTGNGFTKIEINGTGDETWVAITIINPHLYSDAMDADELIIEIEGKQPVTVEYPVFNRL